MYKDYEIKLNAILDKHKEPKRFDFKDVKTVEKAISAVNSLGSGEKVVESVIKFKNIHDKAAIEYDKLEKDIKKIKTSQDKFQKTFSKAEENFNKSISEASQLRNKQIQAYDKLENAANLLEQNARKLGVKTPPIVKEANKLLKTLDKRIDKLNKASKKDLN